MGKKLNSYILVSDSLHTKSDMHVMVEPAITVEYSHSLSHHIENGIREKINESAEVIVHIEPYYKEE